MPRRRPKHSATLTPSRDEYSSPHPTTAPYAVGQSIFDSEVQLESHEILHHLRGQLEEQHRNQIWGGWYHHSFKVADLRQLDRDHALDFFNKTVPIYIMRGDRQEQVPWSGLLSAVLHNYLYRKGFRPYRTDIERSQFIAKIVNCKDQPVSNDDATAVDVAMAIRSTIQTRLLNLPPKQFYTIPALFKALVIIIPSQSYSICSSIANISAMTVLVLLTGENDGLSSSITIDSINDNVERVTFPGMSGIRTKLEIAVDFIMSLEKREVAGFGP